MIRTIKQSIARRRRFEAARVFLSHTTWSQGRESLVRRFGTEAGGAYYEEISTLMREWYLDDDASYRRTHSLDEAADRAEQRFRSVHPEFPDDIVSQFRLRYRLSMH